MSPKLKTHTLCVLSRLLLDRSVANDCRLVYTIEAIISTILETMEDENNTDTFLTKEPQPLLDLKTVISHLDKPQFALNHTTDYASLAALIGILVIGLDNADPPPNDGGRDATIAFNADVDKLAERVHKLWSLINDNKAAHRERTEAKEVLRWFETCLKAGIRTEEKPKGMILDDDTVLEKQRSIMKGFFRRDKAVGNIDGVA
ncbi:hypothetical protein Q9189_004294 [Teloschistes chrysophthalmus]